MPATDSATRDRALQRAAGVGAAQAGRELGVPAATIRAWRRRSGEAGAPAGMDSETWGQLKQVGARDAWKAAQQALAEVRRHLAAGKPRDAQAAALSFAILVDKSGVLEAAAAAAQAAESDRRARLDREQAHVLAEVISALLAALGVPLDPARPIVGTLLRQGLRRRGARGIGGRLGRASRRGPTGVAQKRARPAGPDSADGGLSDSRVALARACLGAATRSYSSSRGRHRRVKELIKYKAYQVAPAELEALLLTHPQIGDAAVIGIEDEEAGEVPKAFVVATGPITPEEVSAFVAERVAPYKKVRAVEIVDEIPKAPSGKILRRVLIDRERAAATSAYGSQASVTP